MTFPGLVLQYNLPGLFNLSTHFRWAQRKSNCTILCSSDLNPLKCNLEIFTMPFSLFLPGAFWDSMKMTMFAVISQAPAGASCSISLLTALVSVLYLPIEKHREPFKHQLTVQPLDQLSLACISDLSVFPCQICLLCFSICLYYFPLWVEPALLLLPQVTELQCTLSCSLFHVPKFLSESETRSDTEFQWISIFQWFPFPQGFNFSKMVDSCWWQFSLNTNNFLTPCG